MRRESEESVRREREGEREGVSGVGRGEGEECVREGVEREGGG